MNNTCAPTYNFYNCCSGSNNENENNSNKFLWKSEQTDSFLTNPPSNDQLHPGGIVQRVDSDKITYLNMEIFHKKCKLIELSVLRFYYTILNQSTLDIDPSYTAFVNLDIVVMDMFGIVLRTISSATMDYKSLFDRKWTNIPLSSVANDLIINPGEVVASKISFGAPDSSNPKKVWLMFRLSGVGELV